MATYKVDRPTTQDPDGLIRRKFTVTDRGISNYSPLSREFTSDPAELDTEEKIAAWEERCARKVLSIMTSRQDGDDEHAAERAKWAPAVEDSKDNTVEEASRR